MPSKYVQDTGSNKVRFTQAPMSELEFSTLRSLSHHLTTFNAGDIVPIACMEVLPHDTFSMDSLDFVIRQTTSLVPVMGQLKADFYAFFVPNRIVNKSWREVMGENSSGSWTANEISLATLVGETDKTSFQVPVGSVADYYGFPTQAPLPKALLQQCHDLKFRGYLEIFNTFFRPTAYTPVVPYSKLNVHNGFFEPLDTTLYLNGTIAPNAQNPVPAYTGWKNAGEEPTLSDADGSYPTGSVLKELYGGQPSAYGQSTIGYRKSSFCALNPPLKASKLHDYFTSVLPTPQRGREVVLPFSGVIPLNASATITKFNSSLGHNTPSMLVSKENGDFSAGYYNLYLGSNGSQAAQVNASSSITEPAYGGRINGTNLVADLSQSNVQLSINDIRFSSAVQQVYELLGRGGGRYVEFVNSFFGIEVDNPFDDIPTLLGHFRRDLDLYQTAQTSASTESSPQGTLSAFGYTSNGGQLFQRTFLEHGYIHCFCVVRHHNVYSSYMSQDNFRLSMLDYYMPQFANISEQPVYTRQINPFNSSLDDVFGYQEAWAEYRYEPDRVSGLMRTGVPGSLAYWNYADDFDSSLEVCTGEWLKSNTREVVARSTALTEEDMPQFKGDFVFNITKERPMPVYSVPGMDIF